jgi:phenylalanine-4-hydroxylase
MVLLSIIALWWNNKSVYRNTRKQKTKKIAQAITFIKGVNKYFENNKSVSWESLIKANLELLEQSVCGIFLRTILLPKWAII